MSKFKVGDLVMYVYDNGEVEGIIYEVDHIHSDNMFSVKHSTRVVCGDNYIKVNKFNRYVRKYKTDVKDWKFPKVDFVKYDAKKLTTVVKFDGDDEVYIAKCKDGDNYDEYTGLLTCLTKKLAKASNQELQGFIKHADNRRIK